MGLFGKMDDLKSLRESLDKIKIKLGIEENKYKERQKRGNFIHRF